MVIIQLIIDILIIWLYNNPLAIHNPLTIHFHMISSIIELDYGKIYRKVLYLMGNRWFPVDYPLKTIHWNWNCNGIPIVVLVTIITIN
jgi:hypothetical protein